MLLTTTARITLTAAARAACRRTSRATTDRFEATAARIQADADRAPGPPPAAYGVAVARSLPGKGRDVRNTARG